MDSLEGRVEGVHRSGDDALMVWVTEFAEHGVGFSGASLAVGKDGAVVAVEDVLDGVAADGIVDEVLFLGGGEDAIESVDGVVEEDGGVVGEGAEVWGGVLIFLLIEWAKSCEDTNVGDFGLGEGSARRVEFFGLWRACPFLGRGVGIEEGGDLLVHLIF